MRRAPDRPGALALLRYRLPGRGRRGIVRPFGRDHILATPDETDLVVRQVGTTIERAEPRAPRERGRAVRRHTGGVVLERARGRDGEGEVLPVAVGPVAPAADG